MSLVIVLLLILFVACALILILMVLLQDEQGEGIGGMFGGGSATTFGSRSGNVLTRFTAILGAIFIFGAFGLGWLNRTPESSDVIRKARIERLKEAEETDWWVEKIEESESPIIESEESPGQDSSETSEINDEEISIEYEETED